MNTIKLKIRHFGPVEEGFRNADGYMSIPKVTLFCGPQGSGKSTIAKVLSSMMWLEKAAEFWQWEGESITIDDEEMLLELLKWHGLSSYFRKDMEISYRGTYMSLDYLGGSLTISAGKGHGVPYIRPKIMYVPAERNFLHLLDSNSKLLPRPLRTLHEEFRLAQNRLKQKKKYQIPVNGYHYIYDDAQKDYFIENSHSGESVSMTPVVESSSGLQSVLPLLLITDNLLNVVKNPPAKVDITSQVISENPFIYRGHRADSVDRIYYTGTGKEVSIESLFHSLTSKSSHLVNIVEEPEQNLFPPTQRAVLRHLLRVNNAIGNNRLIISTHSPYIVGDLVAATRAADILSKVACVPNAQIREQISELIRKCYEPESVVDKGDVCLYETSYDGSIMRSEEANAIPDTNFINYHLKLSNMLFEEMDNIEEMIKQYSLKSI